MEAFPTSVSRHRAFALYEWVRRTRPRATLETGFAYGASTLSICQALRENGAGIHHVIDPYETTKWASIGLELLQRAGLADLVRFYEAPSYRQLPRLVDAQTQIDAAFLDGSHLFDHVLLDCFYVDLMLPAGGVIILDDPWLAAVRKAAQFLVSNRHYRVVNYTNRPLRGAGAPGWMLRAVRWTLQTRLAERAAALFRFEGLLFLEKTRSDDRPWNWYKAF